MKDGELSFAGIDRSTAAPLLGTRSSEIDETTLKRLLADERKRMKSWPPYLRAHGEALLDRCELAVGAK